MGSTTLLHPQDAPTTGAGRPALSCRRCGATLDPGPRAALAATGGTRVLLDCVCAGCGRRALYEAP